MNTQEKVIKILMDEQYQDGLKKITTLLRVLLLKRKGLERIWLQALPVKSD